MASRIEAVATDLLRGLLDLASGMIGFAIQLIAAVTIAVYLLLDAGTIRDWFVGLAPPRYARIPPRCGTRSPPRSPATSAAWSLSPSSPERSPSIAFWALGLPYPLLLGGWVAFCSLIPVFGTYLGVVPALLLALAQSPTTAALTMLAYIVIQQVEDNVLTPRVQGETAHAPPIVILLAVLWTGMAFGVFWSVLAVPALVAARVVYDFFRARLRVRPDQRL